MSIENAFNESVDYYDQWVKTAIPCFDEIFAVAMELLPFDPGQKIRVLDLGAGTGLFSSFIIEKYPEAHFVLIDLADKMLALARDRFKSRSENFQYVCDDYLTFPLETFGPFDLVISSLSIHHLSNKDKQALFRKVFTLLKNEALFLNLDQIKGETAFLQQLYWDTWLWKVQARGGTEEQIASSIQRRKDFDKDASCFDQIQWLKEAGFSNVDCVYRNYFIGLFSGFANKAAN